MGQCNHTSEGICWTIGIYSSRPRHGISKRTPLSSFANIRNNGLIALGLREDDELISVRLTNGEKHIIIGTKAGMMIRFPETDVRTMGRTAAGVKGISLRDG